jgi:antitoxin ChpS
MGNSPAFILPPTVLRNLALAAGDALTSQRQYTLVDIIARCDLSAPPPTDIADWDGMKPAGDEVW